MTVAVANLLAGDGGDALAGDDDADEVDGVGGSYGDDVGGVVVTCSAYGFYGLGKSELLAAEAGDEAAATDFSAGFETTEDAEEIAPFRGVRLANEEVAEEDAVTGEEHSGCGFQGLVRAASLSDYCGLSLLTLRGGVGCNSNADRGVGI